VTGWCSAKCERNEKFRICQVGYGMKWCDGIASLSRKVDASVVIKLCGLLSVFIDDTTVSVVI